MCKSAYIHIPFCKSKCKYCSFVSGVNLESTSVYIKALVEEIKSLYIGEALNTIYFGGGTPSVLPINYIKQILDRLKYNENTEITFEINPDDATPEYLKMLYEIGINRLSFGSQTFHNEILRFIGRRHSAEDTLTAVKKAKQAGFRNISLDLIYGLPFQNLDILINDLAVIKSLDVQHVSTYGLKIETPSYFSKHLPKKLPDNDTQADMYLKINEILESYGYKRYEVSNFAKKSFESKHNLNYWNNSEYYGFGLSAHGYINGIRYSNKENLNEYLNNPACHANEHKVTNKERIEEEIFLGFRKEFGINVFDFKTKFNIDFGDKYKKIIDKYDDYIIKTEIGYKLTLEGVMLSNEILSEFLED